jgi:hypothetical protein
MDANHILQRAGDKKVLLLEPELFALQSGIIGIKHLADRFGGNFVLDGTIVVADVESLKIE